MFFYLGIPIFFTLGMDSDPRLQRCSCFLHNPLDQSKDAPNDEHSSPPGLVTQFFLLVPSGRDPLF